MPTIQGLEFADLRTVRSALTQLRAGILRYEAVYKLIPGAPDGIEFNKNTGLSTSNYSSTQKLEVEAPFSAVRVMWRNRKGSTLVGCKALVGVTETNDFSTGDKLAAPVINGTAYPVVAAGTTVNGFRATTYAGAATVTVPAATTKQQFKISDLVPLSSIPRADGGTRPLLLLRNYINGTVSGFPFSAGGDAARAPINAMRGRTIQVGESYNDGVATPGATFDVGTVSIESEPIITFTRPVLSVWGVGDSITQGSGLVADYFSTWGARACFDVSSAELPVVWANFGSSTSSSASYLNTIENALEAGAPAPSVIVTNSASINTVTGFPTARSIEWARADAYRLLGICRKFSVPIIIWWPTLPNGDTDSAGDALLKAFAAEMRAVAARDGIIWTAAMASLGNGAVPERIKAEFDFGDGTHPNELAIDTVMAPALAAELRGIKNYLGY